MGNARDGRTEGGRKCGIPISGRMREAVARHANVADEARVVSGKRRLRRRSSRADDFHFRPSGRMHINRAERGFALGPPEDATRYDAFFWFYKTDCVTVAVIA